MRRSHKFNAARTVVDGHSFPSKREAKRYRDLKLLERAGLIKDLRLQVKMPVVINSQVVLNYICDFVYWDTSGEVPVLVYNDSKGYRTPEYKIKKRCVEAYYRTKITET